MTGNVLLDLKLPAFQDDLFVLEPGEIRQAMKTLRKLRGLSWNQVYRDHGLKWEEVKGSPGKFTIRLSHRCRAVVRRDGDFMRFQSIHPDHDSAYGKQ